MIICSCKTCDALGVVRAKMLATIRWTIFCHLAFCVSLHGMTSTDANGISTNSTLMVSTDSPNTTSPETTSLTSSLTSAPSTEAPASSTASNQTQKQTSTTEMTSTTSPEAFPPNTITSQPTSSNQTTTMDATTTDTSTTEYSETTETSTNIDANATGATNTTYVYTTDATERETTTALRNDTSTEPSSSTRQSSTPSHRPPSTEYTQSTTLPTSPQSTTVKPTAGDLHVIIPVVSITILLLLIVMVLLVLMKRQNGFPHGAISFKKKRIFSIIERKRPIILENIAKEVQSMHKDDNWLFSLHYEDLTKLSPAHATQHAVAEENKFKNRFINVIPFDHSRVVLPVMNDDPSTDYINANYIPGYNSDREYIATQGPLPNTMNDFWRMIWHHNITSIVMLTPLKENERVKCEQYWPDDEEPVEYGDFVVEKLSSLNMETYVCTTFNISSAVLGQVETRTVKHYHYQHWRDMSAAVERSEIIDFIRTVRLHLKPRDTAPVVVHCSAGVGRTGTYIVLDYIQQFIQQHDLNDKIDIFSFVLRLRNCRVLMVQTESQYRFLYDCAVFLVEEKKRRLAGEEDVEADEHIYENTRQEKNGQLTTVL